MHRQRRKVLIPNRFIFCQVSFSLQWWCIRISISFCCKSQQLTLSISHLFWFVRRHFHAYANLPIVIWHVQTAPDFFWSFPISNLQTESFTPFNTVSHHRHRPTIECMEKTSDKSKNYFVENFSPNYNYVYGVCAKHAPWAVTMMVFGSCSAWSSIWEWHSSPYTKPM